VTILPLALRDVAFEVEGETLLHDVTFELGAGACTVLIGPNGAGKSLTLRLCHGLLEPTRGTVRWGGRTAGETRPRQAMVFQRPVMLRRSALANVEYGLKLRGLRGAARRARAGEALERTGLARLAGRPARALSGGEQQRLALARAWALEPEVWLLDEPTSSLDPAATHAVEEIIRSIRAGGAKIIMTTHDLGQARRLADEILFLHRGTVEEQAPAAGFFAQPASEAARAFLRGELYW